MLALVAVAGVAALVLWPGASVGSSGRTSSARQAAVAAWQEGNAAWAAGDIAAVCDRYDGVGPTGMWATRAICLKSEQQGFDSATSERKQVLRSMTVDPRLVEVIDEATMVIWFRDVRVGGSRPEYFTPDDVAVMRLSEGRWQQVGARYRGVVVGHLPAGLAQVASGGTDRPSTGGSAP